MNARETLAQHGQSVWLDHIRRGTTRGGELTALVDQGLSGVTSDPSTLHAAINEDEEYADQLRALVATRQQSASDIYEFLVLQDVRDAADALLPVYERSDRVDGYVSLELAPSLARDPEGTVEQARRLWVAVARPNLMLKVPGTPEGLAAIEVLVGEGINVDVTMIFSRGAYHCIAEAFIVGAERWVASGGDGGQLASLASFSIGRIDAEVDRRLDEMLDRTTDEAHAAQLRSLKGQTAVANATLAYEIYQRAVDAPRWQALAEQGVRPQRLSWVSTGLEETATSGALFAEKLIGRDTVQTMPRATLDALGSRGTIDATLGTGLEVARDTMERLEALGISMGELTDYLLERGVERLEDAMDDLLGTIALLQRRYRGTRLNRLEATLPGALADGVGATLRGWDSRENTRRLWNRDATLWTDSGEDGWLGWLDLVDRQRKNVEYFREIAQMVAGREFTHVLVLGVGGCSLAPELLSRIYEAPPEFPSLSVLDSTDPTQILAAEAGIQLATTLFIVSSKSGTTLETSALLSYFWERMQTEFGDAAPRHFLALTDPGSALDDFAREHGFWTVQHGAPELRSRYSVFSNFGMVPAAAMGLPVTDFIEEAALMVGACGNVPAAENPGVELGVILGAAANRGRDKLTLITSPAIAPIGAWLEQLIAESTGKHGKAIVAHEREPLLEAHAYSNDRVFVYIRLEATPHLDQDRAVAGLADAGHPVVQITLDDTWSLAQELFRWEIATAVAAAVMGVNPFDEPDIDPSKHETRALIATCERSGVLPAETPLWSGEGVTLFANHASANALHAIVGEHPSLAGWLNAHFSRMRPRDYVAVLAYLPMTVEHERTLHEIRGVVLQATGVATSVGFGPRVLNSTGQAHKGGPNTGLFLQLTCDDAQDLSVPGQRTTFGAVKAAQARGDFEVLGERGRRALRVHLSCDTELGLQTLLTAMELALAHHAEALEQ